MLENLHDYMNKSLDAFKKNLSTIRTGRASSSILDSITVECYGSRMPLSQISTVSCVDAHTLSIQAWDSSNVQAIEKTILQSDLGLNPSSDGNRIIIPIPLLNEDRRKELFKLAHKYSENSKIAIRNIRRSEIDVIKDMKKNNQMSEDEFDRTSKEIQKYTDVAIEKIEEILAEKEKEIMVI